MNDEDAETVEAMYQAGRNLYLRGNRWRTLAFVGWLWVVVDLALHLARLF